MARSFTPVSEIEPGRFDYKIRVRVIHLWKQPEYLNPDKIGSIELILLDEKCSKIQASIKQTLISKYKSVIEEGFAYVFENLLVANADPKFKSTNHSYKLTFMRDTKWSKTNGDGIPKTYFEFVPFPKILGGADKGFLIDVIGHVVQRDILKETSKNNVKTKLLDIALEDLENNRIICTLWGHFAEEMHEFLEINKSEGVVVVVLRMCKLRLFNGMMGISNAFNGTKLFINANLDEVIEYKKRLENGNVTATQVVSQMSGQSTVSLADDLLQTQYMNISDLMEVQEPCFCTVLAKIHKFNTYKGWYYDSCAKCFLKVTPVGPKNFCEKCQDFVVAVPRFKLPIEVIDKTGSTTFMFFDRHVYQFLKKSATDMIQAMQKKKETADYPPEFDSMLHKDIIFKIEITEKNIKQNWQNYVVKRMSAEGDLIERFKTLHSIKDYDQDDESDAAKNLSPHVADNIKAVTQDGITNVTLDVSKDNLDDTDTPSNKSTGKRSAEAIEVTSLFEDSGTQNSTTKMPKIDIKKEKIE